MKIKNLVFPMLLLFVLVLNVNAQDNKGHDEVFLIDENGVNVGVITTEEALSKAKEVELDLVEVNPKANPSIVKIMDYGQLKYDREKKAHKQKMQQKKPSMMVSRLG